MGKFKNGKAAGKDEVTGEMINGGGKRVVNTIWKMCNMGFESGAVLEDWRSAGIKTDCDCTRVKERGQNASIIEVLAC